MFSEGKLKYWNKAFEPKLHFILHRISVFFALSIVSLALNFLGSSKGQWKAPNLPIQVGSRSKDRLDFLKSIFNKNFIR